MDQKAIQELKARCTMAAAQGFHIGRASHYASELQKMVGTPDVTGVAPNSPAYLLLLIDMIEKGTKAPKTMPSPKAEHSKIEVETKVEAASEVEAEEATTEADDAAGGKKKGKKGR